MKIGELAQKAQVSEQTIRYYERLGLLASKREKKSGFRHFIPQDLEKIKLVKELQALQLPLEKIVPLFQIWRQSTTGGEAQSRLSRALKGQLKGMDERLSDYMALKKSLSAALRVSAICEGCMKKPSLEVCRECPKVLAAPEAGFLWPFF